jgi:hypothetical protein
MSEAFDLASALRGLTPGRPLVIADADEVLLMFVEGFDRFLKQRDLCLDLSTYRLHGNVKMRADNTSVLDVEVTALLEEFRQDLDSLEAVDGARDALSSLSGSADIVVLSNIRLDQAAPRRRNLDAVGLCFPLISNSGPKGEAVGALAARAGRPVFFIADIPQHLASALKTVPDIRLVHMVGDERLKPILPRSDVAHLRAESWIEAAKYMRNLLGLSG